MCVLYWILSPAFLVAMVQGERIHSKSVFENDLGEENVLGSEMASTAEAATKQPSFDPRIFGDMLRPYIQLAPQPCGTRLLTTVVINDTMKEEILSSMDSFFKEKQVNGKNVVVAVSEGWNTLDPSHRGVLPLLDGHQLTEETPYTFLKSVRDVISMTLDSDALLRFTFDVGVDMRNCWGDTHDLSNREVCGSEVLNRLLDDLADVEPVLDTTGQSGSTIVTNVEGFIVKNMKDEEEYATLREVMPSIGSNILNRQKSSCFASALAPICVAFQLPSSQGDVQWMAMRKIEIPEGDSASVELDGDNIKDIDIKGPKFANSFRDGKTAAYYMIDKAEVWKKKDTGFAKMFPNGLTLRGCGSRNAAYTLELDTEALLSAEMTDYSLYGKFYATPPEDSYDCICKNSKHPTFPVILDAYAEGVSPIRIAIGIIDYLEKKVSWYDRYLPVSSSTMKKPKVFKEWWMRMWPSYFHLPHRKLNMQSGVIPEDDHAPAEIFRVGEKARALMKIKWNGGDAAFRTTKTINGKNFKAYTQQIPETLAENMASGSKYKVIAGDEGTIVSIENGYLFIHWDQYKSEAKIHKVTPDQIISYETIFPDQ